MCIFKNWGAGNQLSCTTESCLSVSSFKQVLKNTLARILKVKFYISGSSNCYSILSDFCNIIVIMFVKFKSN